MRVYNRMMRITGQKIRGLEKYNDFLNTLLQAIDDERLDTKDSEIDIGEIEECYTYLITNIGNYDKQIYIDFEKIYFEQAEDYYNNIANEITNCNSASVIVDKINSCKRKEFIISLDQTPKQLKTKFDEKFNVIVIIPNVVKILNVYLHLYIGN